MARKKESVIETANKEEPKVITEENSAATVMDEATDEEEVAVTSDEGMEDVYASMGEVKDDKTEASADAETPSETEEPAKPKKARKSSKAERPELTQEQIVENATAFYAHSTKIADKETRRNLRRSKHIITETGSEEIENRNTIRDEEYKELAGSSVSKRILTGTITGMRYANPNNENSILLALVQYKTGSIQVCIPSFLLFDYDENDFGGDRGRAQIEERTIQRLGSRVRFIVRQVYQKDGIAYADSLEAMAKTGYEYYQRNTAKTGRPIVRENDIVQAKVIATARNFIVVDALGAEIRITNEHLSYTRLSDARKKFQVGDDVNIVIKEITQERVTKRKNQYDLMKVTASLREAEDDPRIEKYAQVRIGDIVTGKVSFIDDRGRVFFNIDDKIDCVCKYPEYGKAPVEGDVRSMKITEKNDEQMHIYGVIIR